ncbi:sulfurtransferase FdhD, partial [bacterium]
LYSLPERLREEQETFEETGGLHASAVFDEEGKLLYLREDVGRHNAVDKVVGAALLERNLPLNHHVLMVSGRTSFEIMQKALVARIPMVAAVSAPSSLAVALAREFKMTLVGFLRGRRCNVYAGRERIES